MALGRCNDSKIPRANGSKTGAQAIHVVHEIESVYYREHPENGDAVVEKLIVNKKGDPYSTCGDKRCDHPLPRKLRRGSKLLFVIEQTHQQHSHRPDEIGFRRLGNLELGDVLAKVVRRKVHGRPQSRQLRQVVQRRAPHPIGG